ncbi:ABC transporter permease [Cellulomonas bogoriensis]|uniref:ABC transporter n=1 Tax=Cellulomonas bogoriensis 69B4 = DSM 16987 TaxID=1386082 RepID=A0A0A0C0U8_9CELL|nr:ABC transporter permease [Cellulomonas bogoriensis]KGM13049.1 ABC transporter [Cellulomonas bogoriensis 69B4 = DSM 16987]
MTTATHGTDLRRQLDLTLLHARYQVLETVRVPVALIGNLVFPALALAFFVLPQREVAGDPVAATQAVSQLALFAVLATFIFTYGVGVAEDRALPFDPYVRTLPAGPLPRLAGRLLTGGLFSLTSLVPVVLIGAIGTAADPGAARVALGVVAVLVAGTPFLFAGLAIGYAFTIKAALPLAQVLLFPLAFAGGLFLPPQMFPAWLDTASGFLPTRAGRDLVVHATTGSGATVADVVVLVTWTVLLASLAVWAYRRDEGRRFR